MAGITLVGPHAQQVCPPKWPWTEGLPGPVFGTRETEAKARIQLYLYSRDQMGCPRICLPALRPSKAGNPHLALLCPELQPQPQDPARYHCRCRRKEPWGIGRCY